MTVAIKKSITDDLFHLYVICH